MTYNAKWPIMYGGHQIWTQNEEPSLARVKDKAWWIKEDGSLFVRSGTAWKNQTGISPNTGEATNPNIPVPVSDVDLRADIKLVVDQFIADFKDGSHRIIVKEEASTKVRSEVTALALLLCALQNDVATFDQINVWANSNLKRSLNGELRGPSMWASEFTVGTGVTNWSWNILAENLRTIALGRLCQTQNRQADYNELSSLAKDQRTALNQDEGRYYQTADALQQAVTNPYGNHTVSGGVAWKMQLGSMVPLAYRILKSFTDDTAWDSVLGTYYEVLVKTTNTTGGLPTTMALVPDNNDYATNVHDVGAVANGVNGWTSDASTDFGTTAVKAPLFLRAEATMFADARATAYLSGTFASWALAQWGDSNKFTGGYSHAGTETSTVQKLLWAYGGYFAIKTADAASTIAASIKSTWLTSLKTTNGAGTYFRDVPSAGTPASTTFGNGWMAVAVAIDAGVFADLGNVPGIAGKFNASVSDVVAGGGTASPTTSMPVGAVKLAVTAQSQLAVHTATLSTSTKKTRFQWLASQPACVWLGPEWYGSGSALDAYLAECAAQNAWFQLVLYGIPNRDLGGASAGGSTGAAEYRTWIDSIVAKVGTRPGIYVLEPDSIALMLGQSTADFNARMALIREAIVKIRNVNTAAHVYLDAAHAAWFPDPGALIPGLQKAGVELCHGIVSNVSNFRNEQEVLPWSENLLNRLNLPDVGYIYDSSRSGKVPPPDGSDWQNPLQVRIGGLPQYGGALNAAYPRFRGRLFIKNVGESDGNNAGQGRGAHGGLAAGTFDPTYLYVTGAADNANGDPAGSFVQGTTNAGVAQRPPFPGVPQ